VAFAQRETGGHQTFLNLILLFTYSTMDGL
jgi:hypothetical protein